MEEFKETMSFKISEKLYTISRSNVLRKGKNILKETKDLSAFITTFFRSAKFLEDLELERIIVLDIGENIQLVKEDHRVDCSVGSIIKKTSANSIFNVLKVERLADLNDDRRIVKVDDLAEEGVVLEELTVLHSGACGDLWVVLENSDEVQYVPVGEDICVEHSLVDEDEGLEQGRNKA